MNIQPAEISSILKREIENFGVAGDGAGNDETGDDAL